MTSNLDEQSGSQTWRPPRGPLLRAAAVIIVLLILATTCLAIIAAL